MRISPLQSKNKYLSSKRFYKKLKGNTLREYVHFRTYNCPFKSHSHFPKM